MYLESNESSLAVHGPLCNPTFEQQGALPILDLSPKKGTGKARERERERNRGFYRILRDAIDNIVSPLMVFNGNLRPCFVICEGKMGTKRCQLFFLLKTHKHGRFFLKYLSEAMAVIRKASYGRDAGAYPTFFLSALLLPSYMHALSMQSLFPFTHTRSCIYPRF